MATDPQFPIPNCPPELADGANSAKMVFLIGMPGAGKTYWGEKIALAFDFSFIDLDDYISVQEKASVSALFASYGEKGFREREQKHLTKAIRKGTANIVVACGGGTPCFDKNMELMKAAGTVIYLQAEIAELLIRLEGSNEVRPLLKGRGDLGIYLGELLAKRKSVYEQANHIIPVKLISISTFEKIIL